MLYSRPAGWADLDIAKSVDAENNVDLQIQSLSLQITYDFTRASARQSVLRVDVAQPGFTPYFQVGSPDLNDRGAGRGGFTRTYSSLGTVTVTRARALWAMGIRQVDGQRG